MAEDRKLDVRGLTYAVSDTGGDGPLVLLMHGWPDDRSLWRNALNPLSVAGFRAVSVDWPGHGDSEAPKDRRRYRIPSLGLDTVALIEALGADKAHLVAHDYGATVSWETVTAHQDYFHSYCAISVGHSLEIIKDALGGALFRYYWLILHGMPKTSRRWYLARDARRFKRAFASHPDAKKILAHLQDDHADQTFWTIWERANPSHAVLWRQFFLGHGWRRFSGPAMGIYSTEDEWMTEPQMRRSGRYVQGDWRYEKIKGGHWAPLQKSEEINGLLIDWLASLPKS